MSEGPTMPLWLSSDRSVSVTPPLTGGSSFRNPDVLERIVRQFEVERSPRYKVEDVNGDGRSETWCNLFVSDVTAALGCPVPRVLTKAGSFRWFRADDQCEWFRRDGYAVHGWQQVDASVARMKAQTGNPVVACWRSLSVHTPSHVAIVMPSHGAPGVWIAQAGGSNFSRGPLESGFGKLSPVYFWSHD